MANKQQKYYAVKRGLTPGIYRTWPECQVNVSGYPGAVYKSFTTEEEAVAFLQGGSSKKFYAVKVGLTPGVYDTWEECQNNTAGYPNAKFKSFTSFEEALAFVQGNGVLKDTASVDLATVESTAFVGPIAYVDGSCDADGKRYAYGVVILDGKKEIHLSGWGDDTEMVSMRNVAGEILGAQAAMEYALEHGLKEITIYHDYQGISSWPKGEWKCNKNGTKAYKERYEEIIKTVDIQFVKVKGHSNVFYNDVVDALAKQALEIESGIKKNIAEHIKKIRKESYGKE